MDGKLPPPNPNLTYREDCWSEGETAALVDAWGSRYLELNRGGLRQPQWREVADAVNSRPGASARRHPPRTDVQCKNRVDTLKKKYRAEHARGGASPWAFYGQLDLLVGPTLTASGAPSSKRPSPPRALPMLRRRQSPSRSPSPPMTLPLPNYSRGSNLPSARRGKIRRARRRRAEDHGSSGGVIGAQKMADLAGTEEITDLVEVSAADVEAMLRRERQDCERQRDPRLCMEKLRHLEDVPKVMSLQLLSEITNNFSVERKVGSGTYGQVYKGVQNGTEIAVKMLNLTPGFDDFQQLNKEFENLMRLKHQNIVQLLGYCYETKGEFVDLGNGKRGFAYNIYRALCFEYMHNGSLHDYLSDASRGLDWQARYRIIKGICNGLKYLHEGLEKPTYHLDLKPDNILLDLNMVPKLADFGLSQLFRNDQTQATQSSIGTIGYLPPEYIAQGLVSNKFDIFSLGVVMIRIMTGYDGYFKIDEMSSQEFIDLVQKSWRERLQETPGCISLEDECHQVKRCIEIALDCIKADRKQRPEIGTIIHWLSETDHIDEKLGMSLPHKMRPDAVSLTQKASSSVSDLVDGVSSMDIAAAPSPAQQISSVTHWPIETSTEESNCVSAAPSPLQRITGVLQGPGGTCRKILYDQSSESSKLLDIHPLELRFPWEPNHRNIKCPVTLTNRTDRYVGVWITQPCKDISSNIFLIASCSDAYDDSSQSDSDDESPTILQATLKAHSTIAAALKMESRQDPPIDTMFEVLMVVTESEEHLENLLDSSFKSEPNIDSEFLKRVEKHGGEVHRAMLKAIICDPASCQTVIHNKRFIISALSGFDYIGILDVHPTETWILVTDFNTTVSILNYETEKSEMPPLCISRVRKTRTVKFHISSAKFIAQEQWFVVGDSDGWIHVYSYTTTDKVMEFQPHQRSPRVVFAVHPTSPYLLTCEAESIKLWDWSKGWKCTRKFNYNFSDLWGEKIYSFSDECYLRWSPMDTDTFLSTDTDADGVGQVMVWNIHSSDPITVLEGSYEPPCGFYRDGHQNFMVTYDECCAHIWDNMQTKKSVHKLYLQDKETLQDIACHPTLPILVARVGFSTVCVWDTRTYRLVELIDNDSMTIGHMVLTGTKDSSRLILEHMEGVSVMEINMSTLDAADLQPHKASSSVSDLDVAVAPSQEQAAMEALMSSSLGAMGPLLRKLDQLLAPKYSLRRSLKQAIEVLKEDVEEVNAALVEQSMVDSPSNKAKYWMDEVRELSYDMEDCIDQLMRPHSATDAKVRSVHQFKITRLKINKLPKLLKPFTRMARISEIRALVREASERYERYGLDDCSSNHRFAFTGSSHGRVSALCKTAADLVGVEDSRNEITMWVTNQEEEQLKVLGIIGSAGVGKTTLIRALYRELKGQFECRAFIRMSRKPDMNKIIGEILSQVRGTKQISDDSSVQNSIDSIREHLQYKRYFIVIDDLWDATPWDILIDAFPKGNNCSRIIITAEFQDVAAECSGYHSVSFFEMKPLPSQDSEKLFLHRVFGSEHSCPDQLKEVSGRIIKTSGGLPLAIIMMAGLLASELDNTDLWNQLQKSFFPSLAVLTLEQMLEKIVNLCYNSLPQCLKTCLLYLAIFPEGVTIWKVDLLKQWIAEGFVSTPEDKEGVAESYFDELVNRGMIQPEKINYNDEVLSFTVHHVVFNLISHKSREVKFVAKVDYSQTITVFPMKVHRLSLQFSCATYASKPEGIRRTQVRTLAFFGLQGCMPSIVKFKHLRVLNLELWGDSDDCKNLNLSGLCRLFQLRYLKVACHIFVELPSQIHGLQFLETLEIDAKVSDIPVDIADLPSLLHLSFRDGTKLPDGISGITSLQTLKYFDLGKNSVDNVRSLGELVNLRDLHLTCSEASSSDEHLKRNLVALSSTVGRLANLRSLTLVPGIMGMTVFVDHSYVMSSAPIFLQRLELLSPICTFSILPTWIAKLQRLRTLKCFVRELLQEGIDILAGLSVLTSLSLFVCRSPSQSVVFQSGAFPVLKYFKYRCGALCLDFKDEALPNLRRIKLGFNIHRGDQYVNMISGIEYLFKLKEIALEIGAADGAEESDRRAAEIAFKDAIQKQTKFCCFLNIKRVDRIEEENTLTR